MGVEEKPAAFSSKGLKSISILVASAVIGGIAGVGIANFAFENPSLAANVVAFFAGDLVGGSLALLLMGLPLASRDGVTPDSSRDQRGE